jgi:phosphatidylglycerol---prolipoprotein diacylglyceryl transferase
MLPAVYVHDLDPFAIHFTGNWGIRWYALSYIAGFAAAYFIFVSLAKRGRILLRSREQVMDFIVFAAIGTMVGGRLGYCLLYRPELFIEFSGRPPFWGVLAIHEGGMASHGGIVGLIVACVIYARRLKIPALHLCDLIALAGPLGIALGRVANFINGELYGRPASASLPWAVKFPQEMEAWTAPQVQELRDALEPLGLRGGSDASLTAQVIALIQDGHVAVKDIVAPLLTPRHPSQLYEAGLEGLALGAVLWLIWRVPRKPGVIGGWFLVLYSLVRIAGEQFRTPDAHIGFQALGLTRGQWLSILMLVVGVACLVGWSRRPVERIGGWRRAIPSSGDAAG